MILAIDKIRIDGGTQMRASIDLEVVQSYAEAMRYNERFPHLIVFDDGTHHWLADGFHRLEALKLLGRDVAVVEAMSGSLREAILFAAGANAKHGLRRTNEDKRRAVETLLHDKEWKRMSDRWIGEKCGVSHPLVARVRDQLEKNSSCEPEPRIGQDGKNRKLPAKADTSTSANDTSFQVFHEDTDASEPMADRRAPASAKSTEQAKAISENEALDSDGSDEMWVDDTIRRVLHGPIAAVEALKTRIENAFAARGLYFSSSERRA